MRIILYKAWVALIVTQSLTEKIIREIVVVERWV